MNAKLNDLDMQLISTIEEQVGLLLDKSATELTIINTLVDFIPDVKCLLNSGNDKLLELYFEEYKNFAYFSALIESL